MQTRASKRLAYNLAIIGYEIYNIANTSIVSLEVPSQKILSFIFREVLLWSCNYLENI